MKSRIFFAITVLAATMLAAPSGPFAADEEFKGKIGKTLAESEQYWPEPVAAPEDAPNILVWLIDDMGYGHVGTFGGTTPTPTLDRIQIDKGWLDKKGNTHEKVYNVAWGDAETRQLDAAGKLPAVGNTVDIKNATWTNTIGDSELMTLWEDLDFDPEQRAFYYARVLEIPTPRWVVYDAKRYGIELGDEVWKTLQERAYTSPIWYTP